MKEKLGDNYAAAKLPTFTVDGEQVQMGSFLGCKILGVNTQTQHPVEAMELAEYLTSEDAQIRRYEVRGYGPSNLNAAASEEVSADVALSALAAQSEFGVSQHVLGTFWTPPRPSARSWKPTPKPTCKRFWISLSARSRRSNALKGLLRGTGQPFAFEHGGD